MLKNITFFMAAVSAALPAANAQIPAPLPVETKDDAQYNAGPLTGGGAAAMGWAVTGDPIGAIVRNGRTILYSPTFSGKIEARRWVALIYEADKLTVTLYNNGSAKNADAKLALDILKDAVYAAADSGVLFPKSTSKVVSAGELIDVAQKIANQQQPARPQLPGNAKDQLAPK